MLDDQYLHQLEHIPLEATFLQIIPCKGIVELAHEIINQVEFCWSEKVLIVCANL